MIFDDQMFSKRSSYRVKVVYFTVSRNLRSTIYDDQIQISVIRISASGEHRKWSRGNGTTRGREVQLEIFLVALIVIYRCIKYIYNRTPAAMAFQAFDDLFKRSRGRPPPPPLLLFVSSENLLNKILKSNGNLEVLLRKHISFRARTHASFAACAWGNIFFFFFFQPHNLFPTSNILSREKRPRKFQLINLA